MKVKEGKWMVDPPSGWRYGFPKTWDADGEPDIYKWMVKAGYPQEEADKVDKYGLTYNMWRSDD